MIADDLTVGSAGEHLVCADLLAQGYAAFLSSQNCSFDVAVHMNAKLIRIQVKTTREPRPFLQKGQKHLKGYVFWVRHGKGARREYEKESFDLLALVALDLKQIAYVRRSDVRQTMQFPLPGFAKTECKKFGDYPFSKAIR